MYPILFSIGNIHFYTHGFFVALGILAAAFLIDRLAKSERLENKNFFDYLIYIILIGIVGARLTYGIIYFNQFDHWWQILEIWQGGMVSYGGFLFGFLAFCYFFRQEKEQLKEWLDLGAIGLMLGIAIGRIGCFLNGDAAGVTSTAWYAINARIPTQLFESAWALILAIFGYYFWGRTRKPGLVFPVLIGLYGLGRLAIDAARQEPIIFWHLKSGQIIDIVIIAIAIIALFVIIKPIKK